MAPRGGSIVVTGSPTGIRGSETPDGMFDVTLAPKGEDGDSFEFTYDTPGTYPYYCDIHLGMNAVVIVT